MTLDPLARARTACVPGRGVAQVETLAALLAGTSLLRPGDEGADRADVVLGWGLKPSAHEALDFARERHLPLVRLEDAFLRSVGLGADDPPLGIVVDDIGIYYDADEPSRLEALIATAPDEARTRRARALVALWRQARASKYNHARDYRVPVAEGSVLVVDQTWGDASIAYGRAHPGSFRRMIEAALDENPRAPVLLKVHPDVVAGRKRGHVEKLTAGIASRVRVIGVDAHPPSLLESVARVYTVTSQMGFEALLWGKPVRTFGMPFYAGWGLTQDELVAPTRRTSVSLEALLHAALVDYARYIDPETRERCEPEHLLAWVALQRRMRGRFPPEVLAFGFSRWKKPIVKAFFAGTGVSFASNETPVTPGSTLALWGRRGLPRRAAVDTPVVRLEDGFLRSVGLGADLVRPLSWVMDRRGMYYDARQPSDLEVMLETADFTPELVERARQLRERLLEVGLTKYNVGAGSWQRPKGARPVVLVVGQVETDAAVTYGAPGLHTNLDLLKAVRAARADAWVVYKPHPDVVAKLRSQGRGESDVASHCDEVVVDAGMDGLLKQVDEVHVLTSLAGFEALLRGRAVTTWGCPFYAGWGLTTDELVLERRTRQRTLDELVAAVLILYPTYVSRVSGHFTTPERAVEELRAWRDAGGPTRPSVARRALRAVLGWTKRLRERRQTTDVR
jgi:capsular polysaccharide export protein